MLFHVGRDLVVIRQRPEGGAFRRRAMVAGKQHLRHQSVAVALDRVAQHLQFGGHALFAAATSPNAVSRVICAAA